MESETKQCQNCRQKFTIEPEDFDFYQKISVPPPTFCPECRRQRRLAWTVSLILFKRKCDLCGEEGISMYEPDTPFKIYCHKCWWSDKWDARDYGRDYDFSQPFFKQYNQLLREAPLLGLSIDTITGELSPYTNHTGNSKNCYLIYYSDYNEDSMFGYQFTRTKSLNNCAVAMDSELCFDSINIFKSYNVVGSISNNRSCYDSYFIRDCEGVHHCFIATNIKNGSYIFLGEKTSENEYKKRMKEIDLGSYKQYVFWKQKAHEYFKKSLPQPIWNTLSRNSTGSYVFKSKNCQECYDVTDCEDSKFLMIIKIGKVKDSYDYTDWGENAERLYECMTVGCNVQDVRFTHESGFGLFDLQYCKLSTGGSHHFGCVSMKKTDYCILNRQYTKEEYETLVPKIIQHMNDMPYVDKTGRIYKYGEFFPMEFSPHAYNNSFANFFFPKTKEEVLRDGLRWHEPEIKEYPITMPSSALPDNIKDTTEEIIKEVIGCGTCPKGYKIIKQELDLSKKLNVPLSRQCPFCRIGDTK